MKYFLPTIFCLFLFVPALQARQSAWNHVAFSAAKGLKSGFGTDTIPISDTIKNEFVLAIEDSIGSVDTIPTLDSLLTDETLLNEIRHLIDSMGITKSFFSVDLGAGNKLFSLRNNAFNAQQVSENRISITPSISYYHKSGLGLSATAFLSSFSGKLNFYQYAFSPSYDYLVNRKFAAGVSYAYYLTRNDLSFYATPFKHELYAYARGRKGWLRPGISAGWASGSYKDVRQLDTVIFGIPRRITDTTQVGLTDIAFGFSASHQVSWDNIFSKGDGLILVPLVMLTVGGQTYDLQSKTTIFSGARLRYVSRRYNTTDFENTGLRVQSLSASIHASYFIDKLSLSGGYFLNYFIPESTQKFTHVFSVTAGITF